MCRLHATTLRSLLVVVALPLTLTACARGSSSQSGDSGSVGGFIVAMVVLVLGVFGIAAAIIHFAGSSQSLARKAEEHNARLDFLSSGAVSSEQGPQARRLAEERAVADCIFISYRRDDVASAAGRIADRLKASFGTDRVFLDVASIPIGMSWRQIINMSLSRSFVGLVVMGPNFTGQVNSVPMSSAITEEIDSLLRRGINVVPLVIDDAPLPSSLRLPPLISGLAGRQAEQIRHGSFDSDIERLIAKLRQIEAHR